MSSASSIFVTGSHRSGTTWVGKLLASAPDVFYIHEPFHISHPPGICPVRVERWLQYVGTHNEEHYKTALQRTFDLRFSLGKHIRSAVDASTSHFHDGSRGIVWAMKEWGRWIWARMAGRRPLVKDPLAIFSAEWIASRFDPQIVILVRHPAGFAHSHQRAGWTHDFTSFTEQPALMGRLPDSHARELREAVDEPGDIVDQAALLWKVIYHEVSRYRERHSEWMIVRNEDLATRPLKEFRSLCQFLDIPFDDRFKQSVRTHTSGPTDPEELHAVQRDSQSEAWKWKRKLEKSTIDRIQRLTSPVWEKFYDRSSWK